MQYPAGIPLGHVFGEVRRSTLRRRWVRYEPKNADDCDQQLIADHNVVIFLAVDDSNGRQANRMVLVG
jgi:hypothetical protein